MKLTKEQHKIINSNGDIKINAVAGSGKTTTIIEYAKARPKGSKILYIAFNKSVKMEALKKFADQGLRNVKVETAHSLAYKHIVYQNGYTVRPQTYTILEITQVLELQGNGEKYAEYIVAKHISNFISYFCNSDKKRVKDLNYLDVVHDKKMKSFVKSYYKYIESNTRLLLGKMDEGEIEITHDFYLKKFQLSEPKLNFDTILFDEGQDASGAMLDIFIKQKAVKVIVGDTHQQIYGWRFAVNSLEKTKFKNFQLSMSFRFSQDIANLAIEILNWKKYLGRHKTVSIKGQGISKQDKTKAILARTNLGLLLKAIDLIVEKQKVKKIYFEGNIHSYTYADEGASLYDVLNLYNGKVGLIRDKLLKKMKDMSNLEDYIKQSDDVQLGMMVDIVKKYGNRLPGIIQSIKDKHVDREKAEIIFSTVHRSKGMEYDSVEIVNDFISEEKLEKLKNDPDGKMDLSKLNEEINLLYVAVTRTKNIIRIPQTLMPKKIPPSSQIIIIKEEKESSLGFKKNSVKERNAIHGTNFKRDISKKAWSVEEARVKHKDAYKKWTDELDKELKEMIEWGVPGKEIAKYFGRTPGAIKMRIQKLGLEL